MSVSKIVAAAASSAGGAGLDVDECFSCHLYEGNGSTQTITNNIDLTEGGLVWIKDRENNDTNHGLFDTERGVLLPLKSNTTNQSSTTFNTLTAFNSNGFSLGNRSDASATNASNTDYVSWTFRKAPKFFDVVTWTGSNFGGGRQISHNLGSVPGIIIIKRTSAVSAWYTWHRSTPNSYYTLDSTDEGVTDSTKYYFGDGTNVVAPTSTEFTTQTMNENGFTYVAYLFAHNNNDGEFGPDSDQDIIKCGSYTGNGSTTGPVVNLGFEPQFVMIKTTDNLSRGWAVQDSMRGMVVGGADQRLRWDSSGAEGADNGIAPTSTGFQVETTSTYYNGNGNNYIYMAIRRGSLFPPDDATKVFAIDAATQDSSAETQSLGKYDSGWFFKRSTSEGYAVPRILGRKISFLTGQYAALNWDAGLDNSQGKYFSYTSDSAINYFLKRAPVFFDHLAYSGTGSVNTHQHNLTVQPEMMWIRKLNTSSADALVYHKDLSASTDLRLNTNAPSTDSNIYNNTRPTDTVFTVGTSSKTNDNEGSVNYYAMLFASVSGVSKVGSYTGNGSNQTIDCGFTAGARFILIRRADAGGYNSTVRYYVWDTVRGITSGSDPHIHLYRETTSEPSDSSINPHSSGFIVNEISATNINVSSASYIFYAIA